MNATHPLWILAAQAAGVAPDTKVEAELVKIRAAVAQLREEFIADVPAAPTRDQIRDIAEDEAKRLIPARGWMDRTARMFGLGGLAVALLASIGVIYGISGPTPAPTVDSALTSRVASLEGAIGGIQQQLATQPTPAPAAPAPAAPPATDPAAPATTAPPQVAAMDDANVSAKCDDIVALGNDGYRLSKCADSQVYVCRAYDQPRGQVSECALASTVP